MKSPIDLRKIHGGHSQGYMHYQLALREMARLRAIPWGMNGMECEYYGRLQGFLGIPERPSPFTPASQPVAPEPPPVPHMEGCGAIQVILT